MRHATRVAAIGLMGLGLGASSARGQGAPPPAVTTIGRGEVRLVPDRALLIVRVETQATTALEAGEQHSAKVAAILDSLRLRRFSGDSAQLTNFGVIPVRGFVDRVLSNVAYRIQSTVRIPVDRPEALGEAIDIVLKAGATAISEARFESDSLESARRTAVQRAVTEATATAVATAEAAGLRLGPIMRLETLVNDNTRDPWAGNFGGLAGYFGNARDEIATRSPQGEVTVIATVNSEWRLQAP